MREVAEGRVIQDQAKPGTLLEKRRKQLEESKAAYIAENESLMKKNKQLKERARQVEEEYERSLKERERAEESP